MTPLAVAIARARWVPRQRPKLELVQSEPEIKRLPWASPAVLEIRTEPLSLSRRIQIAVANHYGISLDQMFSPRRTMAISRVRRIAMYLCKQMTDQSLRQVARSFKFDHTSVTVAIKTIEAKRRDNLEFEFELCKLIEDIRETGK